MLDARPLAKNVMVFNMRFFIATLLLLLIVESTLAVEFIKCDKANVDSMGFAWKEQGEAFTGILLCKQGGIEKKTRYLNGSKQGLEVKKDNDFNPPEVEEFYYQDGIAYKSCHEYTLNGKQHRGCRDVDCASEPCR